MQSKRALNAEKKLKKSERLSLSASIMPRETCELLQSTSLCCCSSSSTTSKGMYVRFSRDAYVRVSIMLIATIKRLSLRSWFAPRRSSYCQYCLSFLMFFNAYIVLKWSKTTLLPFTRSFLSHYDWRLALQTSR